MADVLRGSIVKKNNKYYIVVDLEREEGEKRRQKWLSDKAWTTKRAAEKDLPRVLFEASRGVFTTGKALEVGELIDKWYSMTMTNIRESSVRSYRWAIKHIKESIGSKEINKLTPYQVQQLMKAKLEGGMSNTSVRLMFAVLNRAFNQAVIWNLVASNPCAQVERPKVEEFKATIYNGDQMKHLVESAAGTPSYLPIYLAVSCGMRRGEICALRWRDVDIPRKMLHIEHTIYEAGGLSPVKTDKSRRAILMPEGLVEAMQQALEQRDADKEAAGEGYNDQGFVIAREDGHHYHPAFIYQQFRKATAEAGLPAARFHDLRHSHATYLLMSGVPVKAVSERLGHSSTAFTMDRYSKVLKPMQEQAAAAIDHLFE